MTFRNNIVPSEPVPMLSNRQKYNADIPKQVIDMARQGMFPEEMCAELGISMRTLYAWANKRPEFEEAMEQAWHLLHAFWARLVRENIANPAFRQTAALKVMAKRFPATWGNEPRNTLESFLERNAPQDGTTPGTECTHCASVRALSNEELNAEIDMYLERRRVRDTSLKPS